MRRVAMAITVLCSFGLGFAPSASAYVGAPFTHGPDPAGVGLGSEAPVAPGALGKRVAKLVPSEWCGVESSSDDVVNEIDNGPYRYHGVYMVAADAPDRFSALATSMQTDAFQASALLESTYGRAIRFDIGTTCGPQYLDISVVRLPETSAQMAAAARTPTGTFDVVSRALDDAGFETIQPTDTTDDAALRTRNYLVWLDAPAPSGSCGQAAIYDDPSRSQDNLNNLGGKAAVVFRNGDGFCSSNAARHEIGHNLGGLQPVAPHAFDGSHCNDAYEDTMCYSNAPEVASGDRGTFFDYGNDDYWSPPGGPALAWWTVDENRFLCPDATCNVVAGGGSDPVAPAGPARSPVVGGPGSPQVKPARARAHGRLVIRKQRVRRHVWRLRLSARGSGRAVVAVRCRRARHGQVRTVVARRVRLPRALHARVRCVASRPHARLFLR